jgi:hypothetical protein
MDDESHPFTCPFKFKDDLFIDADHRVTLEPPNSTSSYASNSYLRHQEHSEDAISSKTIQGESIHLEAICILSPSMPAFNVSSKFVLRGELMSISKTTMTYPSLVEDLNCHEKESAPPKMEDFINEHGCYFLTTPSIPCSYEKFSKSICICAITYKTHKPFLLSIYKNFKRVVVDTFVYHKFCKFHGVLA